MLILTIIQGPDKGRTFELPDTLPQLLGRSSEALPITDNTVSRRHAELTPDDGDWYLRDLGSQNGTFINGVRLEPAPPEAADAPTAAPAVHSAAPAVPEDPSAPPTVPASRRIKLQPGDQIRIGTTLLSFGLTEQRPRSPVRLLAPDKMDTSIERAIASSEDSVILALELDQPVSAGSISGSTPGAGALRAMYRLSTLISTLPERDRLLEGVLDLVFAEVTPDRGCVLLLQDGEPVPAAVRFAIPHPTPTKAGAPKRSVPGPATSAPGLPGAAPTPRPAEPDRIDLSRTILQHALDKAEGVLSTNAMTDPRFRKGDSVQRLSIRNAMCVPIRAGTRTYGAIYVDSKIGATGFTGERLQLLNAIGQQTGLALGHIELLEQKLQTERLATMGETVAMLSHSIKNILQGLRGGADVVEMGLKKGDLQLARGGWPILKRNLDRIIGLTMNMLAYSRPRALDLELTRVGPILDDCASLLADQCRLRQVALILDPDPEMPPIPIDTGLIHQALMNLLTNAVEAVDAKKGVVTVTASFTPVHGQQGKLQAKGEARIEVTDNGPGIPPEISRRIFEPFFTTKGIRGTGLGLVVTRRIVEQHGGKVTVRSELGKGTTFTVTIPIDPSSGIDPSATTDTRARA